MTVSLLQRVKDTSREILMTVDQAEEPLLTDDLAESERRDLENFCQTLKRTVVSRPEQLVQGIVVFAGPEIVEVFDLRIVIVKDVFFVPTSGGAAKGTYSI
jgi:hypothetical protein